MRGLSFLILLLYFTATNAQEKVCGKYKNEFGEVLVLNPDKTFEYSWKFDLASSWNTGTWIIKNKEYVYLRINEIKDTLKTNNKIELVLSDNEVSNEIEQEKKVMNLISGGGQSRKLPPEKLLIKNHKLFPYSKTGKVQNKKLQSPMNRSTFLKPWFEKD